MLANTMVAVATADNFSMEYADNIDFFWWYILRDLQFDFAEKQLTYLNRYNSLLEDSNENSGDQ